jgi:hypothetical protein
MEVSIPTHTGNTRINDSKQFSKACGSKFDPTGTFGFTSQRIRSDETRASTSVTMLKMLANDAIQKQQHHVSNVRQRGPKATD